MAAKSVYLQNGFNIKEIDMIWYLIFCSSVYGTTATSSVCVAPVAMPTRQACHGVGRQMLEVAGRTGRYRCVSVKKGL
jgi:hypothetical protein